MLDTDIEYIKHYFGAETVFSVKNIFACLQSKEPELKESTFRWRLYALQQAGVLQHVKRGYYALQTEKTLFAPVLDNQLIKISQLFLKTYPEINYCLWSTAWLHDYMVHQPVNYFYVFETEKDVLESCFHLFRTHKITAFQNPDNNLMVNYVTQNNGSVVLKPLISRSPLKNAEKTTIPSPEKILVDIFCDDHIYYIYQGEELRNIFETMFAKHPINFTTLLYYANRRKRKKQITDFLLQKVEIDKQLIQ